MQIGEQEISQRLLSRHAQMRKLWKNWQSGLANEKNVPVD